MATTLSPPTKAGPAAWRYAWSGTSPFYVYRDGKNVFGISSTTKTEWIFENRDPYEPPVVEVIDSTETTADVEQVEHPPYAILQWRGAANAVQYVLQEYDSDTGLWKTWQSVRETGAGYYSFQTPVLDDQTTHTWRVVAMDAAENESYIVHTLYMVRNPDPPTIDISYDAGTGDVTVSARTLATDPTPGLHV